MTTLLDLDLEAEQMRSLATAFGAGGLFEPYTTGTRLKFRKNKFEKFKLDYTSLHTSKGKISKRSKTELSKCQSRLMSLIKTVLSASTPITQTKTLSPLDVLLKSHENVPLLKDSSLYFTRLLWQEVLAQNCYVDGIMDRIENDEERSSHLPDTLQQDKEATDRNFREFYIGSMTTEFGDDINKLRQGGDFNDKSVQTLINCLEVGASLWTQKDKLNMLKST